MTVTRDFRRTLTEGSPTLMDGATGTELIAAGFDPSAGGSVCDWNREHSDRVRAVHTAYQEAGAQVILTNSFTLLGTPDAERRLGEAIKLARESAPGAWVLAAFGGFFKRPLTIPKAAALADGILLETCPDWTTAVTFTEAGAGLRMPMLVSFAFQGSDGEEPTLHDGTTLAELAGRLDELDCYAVGVNCGKEMTIANCAAVVRAYREQSTKPVFAKPNAGTPATAGGTASHPLPPDEFAEGAMTLFYAGACLVGGCCGTTPLHIAVLNRLLTARA